MGISFAEGLAANGEGGKGGPVGDSLEQKNGNDTSIAARGNFEVPPERFFIDRVLWV